MAMFDSSQFNVDTPKNFVEIHTPGQQLALRVDELFTMNGDKKGLLYSNKGQNSTPIIQLANSLEGKLNASVEVVCDIYLDSQGLDDFHNGSPLSIIREKGRQDRISGGSLDQLSRYSIVEEEYGKRAMSVEIVRNGFCVVDIKDKNYKLAIISKDDKYMIMPIKNSILGELKLDNKPGTISPGKLTAWILDNTTSDKVINLTDEELSRTDRFNAKVRKISKKI